MSIGIKKIVLWRTEVDNRPGALAAVLEPLAKAGANLKVVMAYRHPGHESKAAIEVYPIAGRKVVAAAALGGLIAAPIPVLLIEGDDKPGLGSSIAGALARVGINLAFFMAQVLEKRYSAIAGFETEEAAKQAAGILKAVARR
jgi:hypothetical protein